MSRFFEEAYQEEKRIEAAFKAGNETGKGKARADYQRLGERVSAKGNAALRVYREYKNSRDRGNKDLDFKEVIWDKDVEDIIACLRETGIEEFTFSSTWSSAVETAWLFQENGCSLEGLVQINGDEDLFNQGTYKKAPAYLFRVN